MREPGLTASASLGVLAAPWAKFGSGERGYHPLICHMIDVAIVAEALWEKCLAPSVKRRLGSQLGCEEPATKAAVAFLAGLHDIGKLSACFQLKVAGTAERLVEAGFGLPRLTQDFPHGLVTRHLVECILPNTFHTAPAAARRLAEILGGHHGTFSTPHELEGLRNSGHIGRSWYDAGFEHARTLAQAVGLRPPFDPGRLRPPAAMMLAGLVTLADWIGSNSEQFPYAMQPGRSPEELDLPAYVAEARSRAAGALQALDWRAISAERPARLQFSDAFPFSPNQLQEATTRLAEQLEGPSLVVIEAPMGEGKTEAALWLSDRVGGRTGTLGCYVAMPSQATSNQMLARFRSFLGRRYPGDRVILQLLHGQAAMSSEFKYMRQLAREGQVHGPADTERVGAAVVAGEWFAGNKRGLLAPFGVGTVDQALLAVLQTRHVFLRLFGLGQKAVVIDEVHAYDTYMSSLLERLVEWLAALGSPVVLLSATLPSARRKDLAAAYQRGLGVDHAVPTPAYPSITWVDASGAGAQAVTVSSRSKKRLAVQWLRGTDASPEALASSFSATLDEGGCVAVICNTVGSAQRMYSALQKAFPGAADDGLPQVDLLHSRYLARDRLDREARVLGRFAKPEEGVRRPSRAVLVTTQIVEQSLDLDFDAMVTELAPLDLMLQRSGRLHRHNRPRPRLFEEPRLTVLSAAEIEGRLGFERGTKHVYHPHILLRTWLALQGLSFIRVPDDVQELIEAVYDDRPRPSGVPAELAELWATTRRDLDAEVEQERYQAQIRYLKEPSWNRSLAELTKAELEDDSPQLNQALKALTRLTEPGVDVICAVRDGDRLLLPDGPIRPDRQPTLADAGQLLASAVHLTDPRVIFDLLKERPPESWRNSPLLCRHRLLELDHDQGADRGRCRIRIHPDLGVVIEEKDGTHVQVD